MKKFFAVLILLLIFVVSGCSLEPKTEQSQDILKAAQTRGKFIVGVTLDAKPFGFKNSAGQPDGFDIDIAKRIAKELLGSEKAIEFVEINSYDSILTVATGKVDFLIAATTITPQRQILVNFSEPYFTSNQAILVPNNSKIEKIKDLNNRKVIVKLNSTSEKTPKKYAPTAILIGYKTRLEAFQAFKNGKGDAIISDNTLLHGFLMDNKGYKILPFKLSVEPYGIAMQNTPEAKDLKSNIDAVISQMKADGTISKLKTKWKV